MISFIIALAVLIASYFLYGRLVERLFGADEKLITPAIRMKDGVDYVPMPSWKLFLIQFLNIAGIGPIFGAIAGALWGPAAFLWIVLGTILAGGVHDYFAGMLSMRHDGLSIPEIVGIYMGNGFRQFLRLFTVVLLALVGVVFVAGPARLLEGLVPGSDMSMWLYIIFAYYIIATLLPIDKLIGRLYPIFGASLLLMAVGITGGILVKGYTIPEITLSNLHPNDLPIWPLMFITIACGAISGFHSTQSPIMARCCTNERLGKRVFYGAMVTEGIVALIWAAASMAFFGTTGEQATFMAESGEQAGVVNHISISLLGPIGGILAVLGVVFCPVSSGDTAFRSARLTIADVLNLSQKPFRNRLMIAIPLFLVGFVLTQVDFQVIWRYFAWSNQTIAMLVLWTAAVFLKKYNKFHWIASLPAMFMTAVTTTYLMIAPEGFNLSATFSYPAGIALAIMAMMFFLFTGEKTSNGYNTHPE